MEHALKPLSERSSARRRETPPAASVGGPLVWAFDGPFTTCLADVEDALRRAIVQMGDVASLVVLIEISLPALKRRVEAGDAVQPAWGNFLSRVSARYGLSVAPRGRPARPGGVSARLEKLATARCGPFRIAGGAAGAPRAHRRAARDAGRRLQELS